MSKLEIGLSPEVREFLRSEIEKEVKRQLNSSRADRLSAREYAKIMSLAERDKQDSSKVNVKISNK